MTKRTLEELYDNYPNTKFFRITNEKELHNGMQYKTGINEDILPFNPTSTCSSGGLYFFADYQMHTYKKYVIDPYYIREVTFDGLEDVLIYDEGDKIKANKFILSERELFKDALKIIKPTSHNVKEFINLNPESINYINNSNLSYTTIVSILNLKNIVGLKYIKPDMITVSVCYSAILNNGLSLEFVPEEFHTYDICNMACKNNGLALEFVKQSLFNENQLNELYLTAVTNNGLALMFIDRKLLTDKLCLKAIKQNNEAFKIIINDKLSNSSNILTHLINTNETSIVYIPKNYLTEEVCLASVSIDGDHLIHIPDDEKTYNICLSAVKNKGLALQYVPDEHKTYELCHSAVLNNGLALEFIKHQCYELCEIALKQNYESFVFIKEQHENFNLLLITNICNSTSFRQFGHSSFLIKCLQLMKNPFDNITIYDYLMSNLHYYSIWDNIIEQMDMDDKLLIKIISRKPSLFEYIKNPSQVVCNHALQLDNSLIRCITNPDENVLIKMVLDKKLSFSKIKHHTFNLCKQIIEVMPDEVKYVKLNKEDPEYKEQMIELYTIAINKGIHIKYIDSMFHTIENCSIFFENNKDNVNTNIMLINNVDIRKAIREKFNIW